MNRAISRNLDSITPQSLPPARRREGDRLRLLCLGLPIMGLRSFNVELERYCADRDDIDAVHISCVNPLAMKLLIRFPYPAHGDKSVYRASQWWRRMMRWWFRRGGPLDLAHFDAAIVCPQHLALALADAKVAGRGPVLGIHSDATVQTTIRDLGDSPVTTLPLLKIDQYVYGHADLVSGMGTWVTDSVRADYGVPADRTLFIPPVAPLVNAVPTTDDHRLMRIVFTGMDWVRKGGPELLRWHQQHWADRAELHFIGNATAPEGTALKNVVFHGKVDRDRILHDLLPTMDLFVLPTKREMSSWAGVEAMAAGLPFIVSSIGGIPDLVVQGETGFLVKPGDDQGFIQAIESLISNPERCRAMGDAARRRTRAEFNRDVVYSRLIGRIKQLVTARDQTPAGSPV